MWQVYQLIGPQPSKPPPKKKIKFDAPASDSIQSQNVSTALARTESTATRTASASMRPGHGLPASSTSQSDNATSIQPRQSTTALSVKDGIVNVPGAKKAALNSSEPSRKATVPSVGDATRNRVSPVARYMYRSHFGVPYSQKYWRELNLAVEPKIAIARILADSYKFGGLVQDRHTYRVGNFGRF